jgi:adenylate cyclase class 2
MEVESKVKLESSEVEALLKELARLGIHLGEAETQKDVYYKQRGFRERVQGPGDYLIRLRYTGTKTVLNMKHLTAEDGVWNEVETPVQDGAVVEEIVQEIGAEPAVTVTKARRMTRTPELEIIIDEIEELGIFLELSVEGDNLDVLAARQTINDFLKKLGIGPERVELRGYPTILLEKQGVVFTVK